MARVQESIGYIACHPEEKDITLMIHTVLDKHRV